VISTGVFAGLRVAELHKLDRDDVDLNELDVMVRHGKGDKDRLIPLRLEAAIAIDEYLRARSDMEPALFLSRRGSRASIRALRDVVYRVVKEASLTKKISPHKLRHTFATLLYDKTGDLLTLKELLGHESLATTQIYTHVATERKRRAIDA
jgi:integrase/recombinase XerC